MSAFRIALLLGFACIPAIAQERQEATQQERQEANQDVRTQGQSVAQTMAVGSGVICDTRQQAERFATLRSDRDANVALETINNDGAGACSFGLVMFTGGEPVAELAVNGRPVSIVEITVHAFNYGSTWKEVPGVVRYTVVVEKGRVA